MARSRIKPQPVTGRSRLSGPPVTLETERYYLHSLVPDDASESYLAWINDAQIMTPLNMPARKLSLGEMQFYIDSFDNRVKYLIGMFDKKTNTHFGIFMIDTNLPHQSARLNFLIGNKDFRKQGALRECAAAVIEHFFTKRKFEKLTARVIIGNDASANALEALGFDKEGTLKGEVKSFQGKARLDQWLYGLVKDA